MAERQRDRGTDGYTKEFTERLMDRQRGAWMDERTQTLRLSCNYVRTVTILYISFQLTDAEVVADNCRARCQEQRIAYYRFNPEMRKVSIKQCKDF